MHIKILLLLAIASTLRAAEAPAPSALVRLAFYSRTGAPDDIVRQREAQDLHDGSAQESREAHAIEQELVGMVGRMQKLRVSGLDIVDFTPQLQRVRDRLMSMDRLDQGLRHLYLGHRECPDAVSHKLACRSIEFADDVTKRLFTWDHVPAKGHDYLDYYKDFFERSLFVNDERLPVAVPLLDKRLSYCFFADIHNGDKSQTAVLALAIVAIGRGYSLFELLKGRAYRERPYKLGTLTSGNGVDKELTDLLRVWTETGWYYFSDHKGKGVKPGSLEKRIKKFFPGVRYRQPTEQELENTHKDLGI